MNLPVKLLRTLSVCSLLALATASVGCNAFERPNAAKVQWKVARTSVMMSLAREQFANNDLDGARKSITDALTIMPDSAELRVFSARIAIEQGNLELAEAELLKASTADPKNASADYYRGVLMQRWQRTARALELYETACEKNPKELAYVLARAEALVALDREAEAQTLLKTAQDSGDFENSAELRSLRGQIYYRQKKYAEACEQLREATLLSPEEIGIREQLARSLYAAGRKAEATPVLERLVADEKFAKRADLFTQLGECYLAAGRPNEAKAAFETASNLQPGNLDYTLNLTKAALDVGDIRRADLTVRRAVAISPGDAQANLMLGFVRLEQKKYEEALTAFRRSAAADAKDSTATCMAGVVLEKLGRRQDALQQYTKALALDPADPLAKQRLSSLETASISDDR